MIPDYIKTTLKALNDAGYEGYIVGGAVRDMLRGVPVHDYDITTSAVPEETSRIMTSMGFKVIVDSSAKYGTVVFIDPSDTSKRIEITTFRSDADYEDSRHPDKVSFTSSLKEDAARRDFTVNSLYMDAEGNIIDPNNGKADIEAKIIRAVGDPEERFREDALRILRAVRFEAKTGFTIEPETSEAMKRCAPLLKKISAERIFSEFTGVVTAWNGPEAIRHNLEVVSEILPELLIQRDFDQRSKFHDRDLLTHTLDVLKGIPLNEDGVRDRGLAYSALLHDIGKPEMFTIDENGVGHMKKHNIAGMMIAERFADELKFPKDLKFEVSHLVLHHDTFPEPERTTVRRFVHMLGIEMCEKLFVLQKADVEAHSSYGGPRLERLGKIVEIYHEILESNPCLSVKELKINGDDVLALGVSKGPMVGAALEDVLNKVMEEEIPNDREAEISYVKAKFVVN